MVRLIERAHAAGVVELPPSDEHRIAIHLSTATPTTCLDSGFRCVRRRGDVDIIPAGTRGGYTAHAASRAVELRLDRALVAGLAARLADESGQATAPLTTRHLVEDPRIRGLAAAAIAEAGAPPLFLEGLGIALVAQLLVPAVPPRAVAELHIDRVIDFIEAHLDRALTLDQLATVAGTSSAQLRRAFAVRMERPIHRYIVERRVARARELLLRGGRTASDIALATGFAHQSHMARWLRRILGVTPRALQRSRWA